jgi:CRP/FNR family transcriptional regulator, cyclic AMP receptor protein
MQKAQPRSRPAQNDPHQLRAQTEAGRVTGDYRNNQKIFIQGEVAGSVFFTQQGRVKLTATSEQGKPSSGY